MTFWDWLWAWTRDPVVWDWLRPAFAALAGALVGGGFTLWGQRQSAHVQRERDKDAWTREQVASSHERAREDARKLFEDFTDLHREIQESPSGIRLPPRTRWETEWKKIWNRSRSLSLDVRARLIPDDVVRGQVQELVQFLGIASEVSGDSWEGNVVRVPTPLLSIVTQISAEGIDVMGAYLRGAPHASTRDAFWDEMRRTSRDYDQWVDGEIARNEAMYEEWLREQRAAAQAAAPPADDEN
ncbi:hypothetical protein AB0O14_00130 [Microbacterium foliorum]